MRFLLAKLPLHDTNKQHCHTTRKSPTSSSGRLKRIGHMRIHCHGLLLVLICAACLQKGGRSHGTQSTNLRHRRSLADSPYPFKNLRLIDLNDPTKEFVPLVDGTSIEAGNSLTLQIDLNLTVLFVSMFFDGQFIRNDFTSPYTLSDAPFPALNDPGDHEFLFEVFDKTPTSWAGSLPVSFRVVAPVSRNVIRHVQLIDTTATVNGGSGRVLGNGNIVDLSAIGTRDLTMAVTVNRDVSQLSFIFDGSFVANANAAPYLMTGSSTTSFPPLATVGDHTVLVEAFAEGDVWLESYSVMFQVVDSTAKMIFGLELIDVTNPGRDVRFLNSESVVEAGSFWTIEVKTSRPVFQVSMFFDDQFIANDFDLPYALNLETSSAADAFQPLSIPGKHTITVEAFDQMDTFLGAESMTINVVSDTAAPVEPDDNLIVGLRLIDLASAQGNDLGFLTANTVVRPASTLTVEVVTTRPVFQMSLFFDGQFVVNDYSSPYALAENTGSLADAYAPLGQVRSHTITAEAFGEGDVWLATESVSFVVSEDSSASPSGDDLIVELKLIDLANPERDFGFLTGRSIVAPASTLTIEAVTNRPVFQMSIFFDGQFVVNDFEQPYALNQGTDSTSDAFAPLAVMGSHTITVEAFDEGDVWLATESITFQVSDGTSDSSQGSVGVGSSSQIPISTSSVTASVPPATVAAPNISGGQNGAVLLGELRKWHKITLAFTGPFVRETDTNNPFLNFRLDVTFSHDQTGKTYVVPGHFAADGNAANTGASEGNIWHCHFAPDATGAWSYVASFVSGENVAIADSSSAGSPTGFHGQSGTLSVAATNKSGRDHRGSGFGRLQYVGEHHLRFSEGTWFLKAGADSPENLLAYEDFDNTFPEKSWGPHRGDFQAGDPTWQGMKGEGLIGAVNYLSDQGMNAFSFLTMSIEGDSVHVFPYISSSERTRIDVSKTAQWEIVFQHADTKGMFLHFKTQETENDQLLDGGSLGTERRLYYRELVSRFGHHLALNWNLGEEITNTIDQIKSFADHFRRIDPYQHPVVAHTGLNEIGVYQNLLGHPTLDGASTQLSPGNVFSFTRRWVQDSAAAGRKWVVANDEQGDAQSGVLPDANDFDHNQIRQDVLWGAIMAGGAGVEYYFGYGYSCSDLTCQDYRTRENMWVQSRHALNFFSVNDVPFWDMESRSDRASGDDWVLANDDILVIYRRNRSGGTLNLSGLPGSTYSVQWYDPRNGGSLLSGSVGSIVGGSASASYGDPPSSPYGDWAVLVRKE